MKGRISRAAIDVDYQSNKSAPALSRTTVTAQSAKKEGSGPSRASLLDQTLGPLG